jgi:hypothetical protein
MTNLDARNVGRGRQERDLVVVKSVLAHGFLCSELLRFHQRLQHRFIVVFVELDPSALRYRRDGCCSSGGGGFRWPFCFRIACNRQLSRYGGGGGSSRGIINFNRFDWSRRIEKGPMKCIPKDRLDSLWLVPVP